MLIAELDAVIIVLTNSISQGDVATWTAQTLLQAIIDSQPPIDVRPFVRQAAVTCRALHKTISDSLENSRTPCTKEPNHGDLIGKYWHATRALFLEVFQDKNTLRFNINGKRTPEHLLSHYNYDTFVFLPSSDERIRRGLLHYGVKTWLLHFERNSDGHFNSLVWNMDAQAPQGAAFTKDL